MAWPLIALAAAGAIAGGGMANARQKRAENIEDADRKLAAETQRYSWITGNQAGSIRRAPSAFDTVGQGVLSGMGQGMSMYSGFGGGGAAGGAAGAAKANYAGANTNNSWQELQQESGRGGYGGGGGYYGRSSYA